MSSNIIDNPGKEHNRAADCADNWADGASASQPRRFNFRVIREGDCAAVNTRMELRVVRLPFRSRVFAPAPQHRPPRQRQPISTKADVTSGPPTRIRVGVFILFHS